MAAIFILVEWLFWWLLAKNKFVPEGKARPRHHRHAPNARYLVRGALAIKSAIDGVSQRHWRHTRRSSPPASATAKEAASVVSLPHRRSSQNPPRRGSFWEMPKSIPEAILSGRLFSNSRVSFPARCSFSFLICGSVRRDSGRAEFRLI